MYDNPVSAAQVRLWAAEAGLPPVWAVRVARCESGLNPAAVGGPNRDAAGSYDHGLMQINDRWWPHLLQSGDPYHPVDNLRMAAAVYRAQGPSAWVCR